MAVYKCKMCGGSLEIGAESVATCEYCGTQQTLPKLSDDRRVALYDRASHFLRNNEFDKATLIYEQILNEDQSDAEAYWSLVLCRYGIEYVEDPATRKRIPTVNRAQFTSIFDDDNYRSALLHADSAQRQLYEAEARAINEIQRGILAISQREEPFDVFICYKETDKNGRRTPDSVLANELYHQLTQEGFKVFFSRITLEDKLGVAYEPYIFAALNSARVMVVLGTRQEYFNAAWVKNEWSRYLTLIKNGAKKILIPAYRDMDPYDLPEEFSHLQAQDMGRLGFMQDLIRGIKKITRVEEPKPQIVKETVVAAPAANTAPLIRRMFLFLEDGDWDRADDFCEQILNMEPECAEAYLGKLMAELRIHKRDALKDCAEPFDKSNHYRKIVRFANDSLRSELAGYIDHINTRNENARLEKLYREAAGELERANSEAKFKAVSALFAAISGYKDSAALAQQCLEQAEGSRLDVLYAAAKNLMTGEEIPSYQEAIKRFEDLGNWRDSTAQIEICRQKIKEIEEEKERQRLNKLYQKARAELQKANSEEAYKTVSALFSAIGDFEDSAALAQQCLEKAEAARLDVLYAAAKSLMTGSKISNYQEAIKRFEALGQWRDSLTQIELCQKKIKEIEAQIERQRMERIQQEALRERQRLEKLYQEARKNLEKANSEAQFKTAASLFAAIGGYQDSAALSQQCLEKAETTRKNALYTSAKKLMAGKKPNYEEAIRRFEELGDWRDSAEQIEICRQKIAQAGEIKPQRVVRNKKKLFTTVAATVCAAVVLALVLTMVVPPALRYQNAAKLMDAGNYKEAITAFEAMDGYRDSAAKIVECEAAMIERDYQSALRLMDAGGYEEAIAAFEALNGYKDSRYLTAVMLMDKGSYEEAIAAFELQDGYKDSADRILECRYQIADALAEEGSFAAAVEIYTALDTYKDSADKAIECTRKFYDAELENLTDRREIAKAAIFYYKQGEREKSLELWDTVAVRATLAAGRDHTAALRSDGTVVVTGSNIHGQRYVADWKNIIAIAANDCETVGLTSDHTVVQSGRQRPLQEWTDIVAIAAAGEGIMALRADGLVLTTMGSGVWRWSDIVSIAAGGSRTGFHSVGLKADGSLAEDPDQKGITAIAAGDFSTFYLTEDGDVYRQEGAIYKKIYQNKDIASICVGSNAAVGLLRSGGIVLLDDNPSRRGLEWTIQDLSKWDVFQRKDVVAFSSGASHAVALLSDGTLRAYGDNDYGQLNVGGWTDIKMPRQ